MRSLFWQLSWSSSVSWMLNSPSSILQFFAGKWLITPLSKLLSEISLFLFVLRWLTFYDFSHVLVKYSNKVIFWVLKSIEFLFLWLFLCFIICDETLFGFELGMTIGFLFLLYICFTSTCGLLKYILVPFTWLMCWNWSWFFFMSFKNFLLISSSTCDLLLCELIVYWFRFWLLIVCFVTFRCSRPDFLSLTEKLVCEMLFGVSVPPRMTFERFLLYCLFVPLKPWALMFMNTGAMRLLLDASSLWLSCFIDYNWLPERNCSCFLFLILLNSSVKCDLWSR